jgi:hypothetical protein
MVLLASLWLFAVVGVVGLCLACKAAESQALSLPRGHGRRRGIRRTALKRRAACTNRLAGTWRPARRV